MMVATTDRRLLVDHGEIVAVHYDAQTAMLLHYLLLLLTGCQSSTRLLILLLMQMI